MQGKRLAAGALALAFGLQGLTTLLIGYNGLTTLVVLGLLLYGFYQYGRALGKGKLWLYPVAGLLLAFLTLPFAIGWMAGSKSLVQALIFLVLYATATSAVAMYPLLLLREPLKSEELTWAYWGIVLAPLLGLLHPLVGRIAATAANAYAAWLFFRHWNES